MGTHLRVLSEDFPMNTNKTGFGWVSELKHFSPMHGSSLSMVRVNGLEKWRPVYAAKYIHTKDTIILKTIIAQYTLHTIRWFGCLQEFSDISWVSFSNVTSLERLQEMTFK